MFIRVIALCYRLEETREELEEFQISSRELEAELETQLEQLEKNVTSELFPLLHVYMSYCPLLQARRDS